MKFLANENFPLASVRLLRQKNLDVAAIAEDSPGDSDRKVLQRACQEERIILTFDRDYGELIFKHRSSLPAGVIYLRFDPGYPVPSPQSVDPYPAFPPSDAAYPFPFWPIYAPANPYPAAPLPTRIPLSELCAGAGEWKQYTNVDAGFSLEYPAESDAHPGTAGDGESLSIRLKLDCYHG
jgi:hypothetical protein